jgi:hypothetical protein
VDAMLGIELEQTRVFQDLRLKVGSKVKKKGLTKGVLRKVEVL